MPTCMYRLNRAEVHACKQITIYSLFHTSLLRPTCIRYMSVSLVKFNAILRGQLLNLSLGYDGAHGAAKRC